MTYNHNRRCQLANIRSEESNLQALLLSPAPSAESFDLFAIFLAVSTGGILPLFLPCIGFRDKLQVLKIRMSTLSLLRQGSITKVSMRLACTRSLGASGCANVSVGWVLEGYGRRGIQTLQSGLSPSSPSSSSSSPGESVGRETKPEAFLEEAKQGIWFLQLNRPKAKNAISLRLLKVRKNDLVVVVYIRVVFIIIIDGYGCGCIGV